MVAAPALRSTPPIYCPYTRYFVSRSVPKYYCSGPTVPVSGVVHLHLIRTISRSVVLRTLLHYFSRPHQKGASLNAVYNSPPRSETKWSTAEHSEKTRDGFRSHQRFVALSLCSLSLSLCSALRQSGYNRSPPSPLARAHRHGAARTYSFTQIYFYRAPTSAYAVRKCNQYAPNDRRHLKCYRHLRCCERFSLPLGFRTADLSIPPPSTPPCNSHPTAPALSHSHRFNPLFPSSLPYH